MRHVIFGFLLLMHLPALAQPADSSYASFTLHVTDFDTGIVLQHAEVQITELGLYGITDENGVAILTEIPPGAHVITVECERYTGEVLVVTFEAGDVKEGNLRLLRAPIELDEIEVVDERMEEVLQRRGFYERREKGTGRFVTKSEMDEKGKILLSEALRGMRGVSIIHRGGSNLAVSRRRGLTCPLRVYMDGSRLSGGDSLDIDIVPLETVAGVEVYIGPSEIPMQYNQFNVCGVLIIWTRS